MNPATNKAVRLLLEGQISLAQASLNGMRIDETYYQKTRERLLKKIEFHKEMFKKTEIYKEWKKIYGPKTNIESKEQLSGVLFNHMGFVPVAWTNHPTNPVPKTDSEALSVLGIDELEDWSSLLTAKDMLSTFVNNILAESVDGYLHPFFHLHKVQTYRSSSSNINFQNMPKRDKAKKKLIRKGLIPRKGCRLVEIDFSGNEVSGSAAFHRDPSFIQYLTRDDIDMHWDCAKRIYMLPDGLECSSPDKKTAETLKAIRYSAKNGYTFPQFYGSWWKDCAVSLWENIHSLHLTTPDGKDITQHLQENGINGLGTPIKEKKNGRTFFKAPPNTFLSHVADFEKYFWNEMFPTYKQWKEDWIKEYYVKGYCDTPTGFRIKGDLSRNCIINYPVQGSSFHLLVWCFIKFMRELEQRNFKSLLIGQVHDSIVADVPDEEFEDFVALGFDICENKVYNDPWGEWIVVKPEVDCEYSEVDGSWANMNDYERNEGNAA